MTRLKEIDAQLASIENTMNEYSKIKTELQCERVLLICPYKIGDILVNKYEKRARILETNMNKDTVIEALIERFTTPINCCDDELWKCIDNADLIRASCENIYQQGILQGKYESLVESLKALKGEDNHG